MVKRKRVSRQQEFRKGIKKVKAKSTNEDDVDETLVANLKKQLCFVVKENINLKQQLEQETKKSKRLKTLLKLEKRKAVSKGHKLRGARAELAKTKKRHSTEAKSSYSLVETFRTRTNANFFTRKINFMAFIRFIQHSCMLSDQKMSLCIDLIFAAFFGKEPPTRFVMSPSTISHWNIVLGEADKLLLKRFFCTNNNMIYLWGDDSNKGNEERHVFGAHVWDSTKGRPSGLVLGNYLTAGSSGKEQSVVEFHIARNVYGMREVGGIVSDNAQTQIGKHNGLVKKLSDLLGTELFSIGCYPHVLNIMLRRMCYEGFGGKGDMTSFNLMQMHFKVGWVHRDRPSEYKALYVSLGITKTPPPLPQQWVETRWTYLHESLSWWVKYGPQCLELAGRMLERLPASDTHFAVWEAIVRMAAHPMIKLQQVFLLEFLEKFIMPNLKLSESNDPELQFGPGYLARLWPGKVREDILQIQQYLKQPDTHFPKTHQAVMKTDERSHTHFVNQVQVPMLKESLCVLNNHATGWLTFPKFFGMGADTKFRHFFWRAVVKVLDLELEPRTFSCFCYPPIEFTPATEEAQSLYDDLCEAAIELKSVELLLLHCSNLGLIDIDSYTNQSSCSAWFTEFEILTLVAAEEEGLKKWAARWEICSKPLLKEIRAIADTNTPKLINAKLEPELYKWYAKYVFAIPVNNVIAERQFNIASLFLQPNKSELSKQATQCFVENVIHNSDDHQELLRILKDDNPGKATPSKIKVTTKVRDHARKQMAAYASGITPPLLVQASRLARELQKKEDSTAGPLTAKDLYPTKFLARPVKPDGHEVVDKARKEGATTSLKWIATRKKDKVQHIDQLRTFSPLIYNNVWTATDVPTLKVLAAQCVSNCSKDLPVGELPRQCQVLVSYMLPKPSLTAKAYPGVCHKTLKKRELPAWLQKH